MADLISNVTLFIESALAWITTYLNAITNTPFLFAAVLLSFVGVGITLIKRLTKV